MNKIHKISSIAIAFALVSQSLFLTPALANTTPIVSKTEFSETTRNMDLTNKVEVFPSPIYSKDPLTGEWMPNWEGERESSSLFQASVSEASPFENLLAEEKLAAGTANAQQNIAFLKFGNELPDLAGGLVLNAELNLFEIDKPVKWGYGDEANIDRSYSVHKVLSNWEGNSVSWGIRPQISEPYVANTMLIGKDGGHFKWDITKMVAEWYQNPLTDFGLAVKGNEDMAESLRSFYTSKDYSNKSYAQLDKAPRLIVNYSPRPKFASGLGHGYELNSGEAYVDLTWPIQQGVKGYKLSIFNGKDYQTIDVGLTNSWTSSNKNLWPSSAEIENGAHQLKLDGSGADLSSNPGLLYENAGNTEKDPNRYYFKLMAYNEYGESGQSEELSVRVPDRTAPDKVLDVEITAASPNGVNVKWENQQNAKEYRVKIGSNPGGDDIASNVKMSSNEVFIASNMLFPRQTIFVSVEAVDEEGNYSGYTAPVSAVIKNKNDAEIVSMPSSSSAEGNLAMAISVKNMGSDSWTMEKGYELKLVSGDALLIADPLLAEEVIGPDETKTFQVRFSGQRPLGEVSLQWQMHQANNGFFGNKFTKTTSFYDSGNPEVSIDAPNTLASLYKTVEFKGTVKDATLKEYKLLYGSGNAPSSWTEISSGSNPVENSLIGRWDTLGIAPGTYTLKVEATDYAGNVSSVTREVKVNLPVSEPIAKEITDKTTIVAGGTLQTGLTVYVQKGSQVLGSVLVDNAGLFTIPIAKQQAGTVLTLYAENGFGIKSKVVSTLVKDATPPPAPKVYAVADNSLKISGTAEKGSTIIVSKGTTKIAGGTTSAEGTFAVTIAKQAAGTKLQVKAKDVANNLSAETIVIVIDKTPPPAPSVNTIADYSSSVKGTAEKNAVITIKKGSTVIGTAKANQYGVFAATISKQKAGTILYTTAKDAAGNTSSSTKKTVIDKTAPAVPTVKTVYSYSSAVSGKTEPYAIVTVKKGSTIIGSSKASATGVYWVKIKPQPKRTVLTVSAKDAAGNLSKAVSTTVR